MLLVTWSRYFQPRHFCIFANVINQCLQVRLITQPDQLKAEKMLGKNVEPEPRSGKLQEILQKVFLVFGITDLKRIFHLPHLFLTSLVYFRNKWLKRCEISNHFLGEVIHPQIIKWSQFHKLKCVKLISNRLNKEDQSAEHQLMSSKRCCAPTGSEEAE